MIITTQTREEFLVLFIEGRIDTITTPELQSAVLKSFQKCNNIELDFGRVDYISSAGLRMLVIGAKTAKGKSGVFHLSNVGEQVMGILKMTGLISIISVI